MKIVVSILLWMITMLNANLVEQGYKEEEQSNYKKAFTLYKEACTKQDSVGCNNLGVLYETGKGTKKNLEKAFQHYQKSCTLDAGIGCANLGLMYSSGIYVEKNLFKAFEIYKTNCIDNPKNCSDLSSCYLNGSGVSKSYKLALKYGNISCNAGNGAGCRMEALTKAYKILEEPEEVNLANSTGLRSILVISEKKTVLDLAKKSCEMRDQLGCELYNNMFDAYKQEAKIKCKYNDQFMCDFYKELLDY